MPMTTAEAEKRRASRDGGTFGDGPLDTLEDTEQFKRVADDVVQYHFTVDDSVTYAQPFTMSMPLTPLSGGVLLPYECHEGNLAVGTRSARSAPRTARSRRTWPKASSVSAALVASSWSLVEAKESYS
jgi:hypothetical protein